MAQRQTATAMKSRMIVCGPMNKDPIYETVLLGKAKLIDRMKPGCGGNFLQEERGQQSHLVSGPGDFGGNPAHYTPNSMVISN
jgi:hypothetical protein